MKRPLQLTLICLSLLLASCGSEGPGSDAVQATLPAESGQVENQLEPGWSEIGTVISEPGEVEIFDKPGDEQPRQSLTHPRTVPGVESKVPLLFTIISYSADEQWAQVNLPVKPNGSTGWVKTDLLEIAANAYSIKIDKASFNLQVFEGETEIVNEPVAIGTGATATPVGNFYITELIASTNEFYGPFAYGLSGFSEDLKEFNGNDAIIGIHGTNDPSSIGKPASAGCVRIDNQVITMLVELLPLGTPVQII